MCEIVTESALLAAFYLDKYFLILVPVKTGI